MRRFDAIWRVRRLEGDVWAVIGRYGFVVPDTYPVRHYVVCCSFASERMANSRLRVLRAAGVAFEVVQGVWGGDVTLKIKNYDTEALLRALRPVLSLYVRKHYPRRKLAGVALKSRLDAENMKSLHA